jgi:hypothetical protein
MTYSEFHFFWNPKRNGGHRLFQNCGGNSQETRHRLLVRTSKDTAGWLQLLFGRVLAMDQKSWLLMGFSWDVHGMFMGFSWDFHGIFMGCSWDFHGIFMGYSRHFHGILMGF